MTIYRAGRGQIFNIGGRILTPGAAAAGGGWSPLDLASLTAWWDFSDATTLYTDAGTTQVSADGDLIYQADDQGATYNASQATSGLRPVYKTAIQNGLSIARFDGVDDVLKTGTLSAALSAVTVVAVLDFTRALPLTHPQIDAYIGQDISWGTAGFGMYLTNTYASTTQTYAQIEPAGLTNRAFWKNGTSFAQGVAGNYVDDGFAIVSGMATIGATTTAALSIGNGKTVSTWKFKGDFGEMVVCNALLGTADHNALGGYLSAKWNLSWSDIA